VKFGFIAVFLCFGLFYPTVLTTKWLSIHVCCLSVPYTTNRGTLSISYATDRGSLVKWMDTGFDFRHEECWIFSATKCSRRSVPPCFLYHRVRALLHEGEVARALSGHVAPCSDQDRTAGTPSALSRTRTRTVMVLMLCVLGTGSLHWSLIGATVYLCLRPRVRFRTPSFGSRWMRY
jgi:hypothetical protein